MGYCSQYCNLLWAGRSGNWIPEEREIFHTCVDLPWGPPSLLYNGYQVSFPRVKQPRHGIDHPSPSSAKFKERVELYLHSPSGSSWPILGWTYFQRVKTSNTVILKNNTYRNKLFNLPRSNFFYNMHWTFPWVFECLPDSELAHLPSSGKPFPRLRETPILI
jgi:hypothetical protein